MTDQQENQETVQEIHKALCAQAEFSSAMRAKLYSKCLDGRRGWDVPENKGNIKMLLADCVDELIRDDNHTKAIDVANFAMMLYFIGKTEREADHETN